MSAAALFLLLAVVDAGAVLRTSVSYNTQKASLPLSEEQRATADRLLLEARKASGAGKLPEAMRLLHQGMAVMQGAAWTPAVEFASSLEAKADHAVLKPGQTVAVSWSPIYQGSTAQVLNGTAVLVAEGATAPAATLASKLTVQEGKLAPVTMAIPAGTVAGNYWLEIRLADPAKADEPRARAAYVKRLPVQVSPIAAEAARLRARLAGSERKHPLAEYISELYQRADAGEASPHKYDFAREFARANEVLDAVAQGEDPLAGRTGDLRMAYRSEVDKTLQPYRLFVPSAYDGKGARALVVALHGMGGDENSFFNGYQNGVIKAEAEKRGWFVVCPKGRDSASMYRGAAETDVLDVIAEVRRLYRIDAARIYLMGHSMGGYGTWSVAMTRPDLFAALGPVAGGGNPAGLEKIKHIPHFVVHGDNDKTVPVTQSRAMVEAARRLEVKVTYVEVPGGNHVDIVVPQLGPMFTFFAEQARR